MEEKKYTADGMNIEVDKYEDEKIRERRIMAYAFKMVRKESGMNRKDFAEWLGIPYRTMQDWERGVSEVPDYVLNLIAYKVKNEKEFNKKTELNIELNKLLKEMEALKNE